MALVRVNKANAGNTNTLTNYPTASFVANSGDLLIAFFSFSLAAASATLPIIGSTGTTLTGITWTQIATLQWTPTNIDRLTAWYGVVSSTSTGVLTFIVPSGCAGAIWSVFAYTGHDTAGPVSAGVSMIDGDATTGPLSTSALTGALTVWGTCRNATATPVGSHAGATVIHDPTHAAPTRNLITMEEAGENAPTVVWGTTYNAAMIAFKIREAVAAGIPYNVVVGGVKKTVVSERVIIGGVKKTVVNKWVIVSGVKKPMV